MLVPLVEWCLKNHVPVTTAYRWIAQESFPTSKKHGMRWVEENTPIPNIPKGRPTKAPDAPVQRYTRKPKKVEEVPTETKVTLSVQPDKSSDTEQVWNPLDFAGVPTEETTPEAPGMSFKVTTSMLTNERSTEALKKRGRPKGSKNKLVESPAVIPEASAEAPKKRGRPKGSKNKSNN